MRDVTWRGEETLDTLFRNMTEGFAYHRIVLDSRGQPCDYVFLEVNESFARMTGLKAADIVGKKATEVLTGLEKDPTDWIGRYGRVALTGRPDQFESRSEALDKWFEVSAFSPQKGFFAVTFNDITGRKRAEEVVGARLRLLMAANLEAKSVDDILRLALDEMEARTGSAIGFYHFLEQDQETLFLQNWSTKTLRGMCTAEGKGSHYPVAQAGVWADCVRQRRPIIHNDYAALPDRRGLPPGHAPVARELVVPVMRGERIVAIIGVGNKPSDYLPADVEAVSLLADFSWEIVERKRAEAELRLNVEQLKRFNRALVEQELRMIALKKQVNGLLQRLGEPPAYELGLAQERP